MATKKKSTTKAVPVKADVAPAPKPVEQAPVENNSGHRHVYERVPGLRQGETIDFCAVCADVQPVS